MTFDYDKFRKQFPNLNPMLMALPVEGLEEYAYKMDIYNGMESNYLKILDILRQLDGLDLNNDYKGRIDENFRNLFLNSMEREIEQRSIFAKWLNQ